MKNLSLTLLTIIVGLVPSFAQICHSQDTVKIFRHRTSNPSGITISSRDKVAVAACRADSFGMPAPVKIWNSRIDFMQGYQPDDSIIAIGSQGVAYDSSGHLFVVQTQRGDSNLLIFDDTLGLMRVIGNSTGLASWSRPRGIAFDAAQNLYVVSDDSVGPGPSFPIIPNTGKVIRIADPLGSATKTVMLRGLNGPKGISIAGSRLYLTESGDNELARYDMSSWSKIDSITLRLGMDVAVVDCRAYATQQHDNTVQIYNASALNDASSAQTVTRPVDSAGKAGIVVDKAKNLFFSVNDSSEVIFFRGVVPDPYTTAGGGFAFRRFCAGTTSSLGWDTTGTWTSIDTSVVTVDSGGTLTGLGSGSAFVVHAHGIIDTYVVTVDVLDTAGFGRPYTQWYGTNIFDSAHTCLWYTRNMYSTGSYDWWYSSDPRKVIINGLDGTAWPQDTGRVFVYCRKGNSCAMAVDSFLLIVDGDPFTDTIIGPGQICPGSVTHYWNSTPNGRWISSDPSVATVDAYGNVRALTVGATSLMYKVGTICDSAVTVRIINVMHDALVTPITAPSYVCLSGTILLTNDSTDGIWSSSDTTILALVAISSDSAIGLPRRSGTVSVTYTKSNFCGTRSVATTINVLDTFSAHFTYNDSICLGTVDTLHPASGGGIWSVSDSTVASVSVFGVVSGLGVGTTTISHTVSTFCSSDTAAGMLTVLPPVVPVVTVTSSPLDSISYAGQTVTYSATVSGGGSAPTYQWYRNGVLASGATSSTYSIVVYGDDTVTCSVTSNEPCATPATVTSAPALIYGAYLSVGNIELIVGNINVIPNPNSGAFRLKMNGLDDGAYVVEIRDIWGKLVTKSMASVRQNIFDSSIGSDQHFSKGVYLLRVSGNGKSASVKFVVE